MAARRSTKLPEVSASTDWAPHVEWLENAGVSWNEDFLSFGPGICGGSTSSSKPSRGNNAASASDAGVEAFARRKVDPGVELCWIPYSSVLSVANSKHKKILEVRENSFNSRGAVAALDDDVRLTLAILGEMQLGAKSRWYGYLQSLPRSPMLLPTGWSDGLLQWLRGTELDPNDIKEERRGLKRCFEQMMPVLRKMGLLSKSTSTAEVGRLRRDFLMARGWVSSRAFATPAARHGSALTPLMDIFNHRHDGDDIELSLEVAKGRQAKTKQASGKNKKKPGASFVVMSMRALKKGQVVRNRYGDFANCVLLRKHGFCIPGNPHDVVYLRRAEILTAAKQEFRRLDARNTSSASARKVPFSTRLRLAQAMEAGRLFGPSLEGSPSHRGEDDTNKDDDLSSSDESEANDEDDLDSDDEEGEEGRGASPWIALSLREPLPSNLLGLLAVLLAAHAEDLELVRKVLPTAGRKRVIEATTSDEGSLQARNRVRRLFPKVHFLLQGTEQASSGSSASKASEARRKRMRGKSTTKAKAKAAASKKAARLLFKECPAAAKVVAKVVLDRLGKYRDEIHPTSGQTAEEKRCFAAATILRRSELNILKTVQGIASPSKRTKM